MKVIYGLVCTFLMIGYGFAKAPVVENHSLLRAKGNRLPAHADSIKVKHLDYYLDLSCAEVVSHNKSDQFALYLAERFSELDEDFCSLVGEIDLEEDFSQASSERVGLGTYSKLVESHYYEFKSLNNL